MSLRESFFDLECYRSSFLVVKAVPIGRYDSYDRIDQGLSYDVDDGSTQGYTANVDPFLECRSFRDDVESSCVHAKAGTDGWRDKTNKDNIKVRKPPPWEQYNVKFDTSLTEFEKGNTNALVLQKEFLNLKEQYNEHYEIYTDGSKQDHKVAAAFFLPDDPGDSVSARLRDYSSVYSAELEAILMAMKMVKSKLSRRKRHFAVFVDSLSALQALENRHFKNKNVRRIFNIIRTLPQRVSITFIWTPAHVGIKGNETVTNMPRMPFLDVKLRSTV
ncbi:hypothetical protein EGW08_004974 [Elysia chlorotica]|uniref:RNase H type-1 domain-containing protein n=1 Tax=Elysia chlorotica TaxID=188477 RepID=A0A433U0B6_ELYCH|nr:hypothetical protein EGW08_004974 [Elysia chlorotica]